MKELPISVAITTHNRLEELKRTIGQLQAFKGDFAEILLCADGCNDGTQQFVRAHYPDIRLFENYPGKGSIPSRNRMITAAATPLVLLLDDDSYPLDLDFFNQVARIMEANPHIGVLTFPQRSDEFPESLACQHFGPDERVGTFTSSGAIIRRDLFLSLGGFPDLFRHAYEEPDYSLRVHAAGFLIARKNTLCIRHHYTGIMRNERRTHRLHARNEFWSTVMRAPLVLVLPALVYRVFSQFRYACTRGIDWFIREPLWWWQAFRGIPRALKYRQPVRIKDYQGWLTLIRRPKELQISDG